MEISFNNSYYSKDVKLSHGDTDITIDVGEREWEMMEDGEMKCIMRDVSDEAMEKFTQMMAEMVYSRKREFDSSDLIETLFEKLPTDKAVELAARLKEQYYEDEE
ncbi:MAG: hypothetical protein H6546_02765 [Chitinophagales bacterium]|nr:hypothetical protein [Chitinophagales bacterium]